MRAATLTSKLLTFSRKGERQTFLLDVHAIIQDVVEMLKHTMDPRIELKMDLNAKLPGVNGDYSQLQNTFLNLALNARDAMPHGGQLTFATENVSFSEESMSSHEYAIAPGLYVMVSVADTGVGMTETMKARIFEPFFTTKDVGQGTGLGLSGVYGAVKSHGGSVDVFSELGKGTNFKIYLPHAKSAS